jgi:hypothetical protein
LRTGTPPTLIILLPSMLRSQFQCSLSLLPLGGPGWGSLRTSTRPTVNLLLPAVLDSRFGCSFSMNLLLLGGPGWGIIDNWRHSPHVESMYRVLTCMRAFICKSQNWEGKHQPVVCLWQKSRSAAMIAESEFSEICFTCTFCGVPKPRSSLPRAREEWGLSCSARCIPGWEY